MSNFVDDNLTLPYPKTDLTPLGSGDPNKYVTASDWNRVCQAEIDLRTAVIAKVAKVGAQSMEGPLSITFATGNTFVVDTNTFVVDATNNRVGILTASPDAALHVAGLIHTSTGGIKFPSLCLTQSATSPFA